MKKINKLDPFNVAGIIADFPRQVEKGIRFSIKPALPTKKFADVIICGMGGSALAGLFLRDIFPKIKVHRNYDLPCLNISKDTLIICVSYSGNTEETISAYLEAKKRKLSILAISTNGKLFSLAKKDKTPFIKIQSIKIEPRFSVVEQLAIVAKTLWQIELIPPIDLETAAKIMKPSLKNEGQKIAQKLYGKMPIIYSGASQEALSYFWKIAFNENAKIPAFSNVFPELNHNEMMQWKGYQSTIKNFLIINLENPDDHPRIIDRMKNSNEIFRKKDVSTEIIKIKGSSPLEKIFYGIALGSWTSYYLALANKLDPTDPDMREEFKKMMSK